MSEVLFSASAVRPASDAEDSTAGQTAGESDCYKLAFYNIGANVPATPTTDAHSSELSEICDMVHNTNKRIIDGLTSEICDMAQSAEPPAWKGESDAHYVVVWKSQRLVLKAHKEIIYQWPSKITKDLQFQQAEWPSGPTVHVYHHCSAVRSVPVLVSVCPRRNAARPVPVMVGID